MKKYYALFVRNNIDFDLADEVEKFVDYVKKTQDIDLLYDVVDTSLPLKHKDFGIAVEGGKTAWGLDGIKEQLRQEGVVPSGRYHVVFFLYKLGEWNFAERVLGAWTYPNHLNGAVFCEIPSLLLWEQIDDTFRVLTHENLHAEHRILWWKGIATRDTMDLYDKERDVWSPDGNRARNLKEIEPHLFRLCESPLQKRILDLWGLVLSLISQITLLLRQKPKEEVNVPPPPEDAGNGELPPKKSMLEPWAEAIRAQEGWFKGSRSQRNNNPGNLRYAGQAGATGKDAQSFAIFATHEDGWRALLRQLEVAANGTSSAYRSDMTLFEFFGTYAPSSDGNDPKAYALYVAQRLGVDPTIKIKELL